MTDTIGTLDAIPVAFRNQYAMRTSNGSFWTDGRSLYSYETPIAHWERGVGIVFDYTATDKFSQTTTGHINTFERDLGRGPRMGFPRTCDICYAQAVWLDGESLCPTCKDRGEGQVLPDDH